jgi:hypothetical protein
MIENSHNNGSKATRRVVVALVAVLCLTAAAPAFAQTTDASRLKDLIDRNAELLQQAAELVSETNSVKARTSLSVAETLHKESVQFYSNSYFLRAAQTAQKAREAILRTIALAKRETRLEESAKKAIERATFRLEQGRQLVHGTAGDVAAPRKLLDEAEGQLQRSRHNMQEHLYEMALRLAVSSEELSARAIALIRQDVGDADWVARELEKTDRVIERFGEQIGDGGPPQAQRTLDDAQNLQHRARAAAREGRPRLALELTDKARDVAMRGLRLVAEGADRENVERAIALTDQLRDLLRDALGGLAHHLDPGEIESTLQGTDDILVRAREDVTESGNDVAEGLMARAQDKQKRAWEAFKQERLRAALANTRLARRMAQRAVAVANGDER